MSEDVTVQPQRLTPSSFIYYHARQRSLRDRGTILPSISWRLHKVIRSTWSC